MTHRNGRWRVSVGNTVFPVDAVDLAEEFFHAGGMKTLTLVQGQKNGPLLLSQPANRLESGQFFSLHIDPPSSGYLTLFYVDNAGVTLALKKTCRFAGARR